MQLEHSSSWLCGKGTWKLLCPRERWPREKGHPERRPLLLMPDYDVPCIKLRVLPLFTFAKTLPLFQYSLHDFP